jgi:hypothetical protein
MSRWWAAAAAQLAVAVFLGAGFTAQDDALAASAVTLGIDTQAVPPFARDVLPFLERALRADCPDLPALWVVAQIQAESSWDPRAFSPAGAAGLLQLMPGTWAAAGGAGGGWSAAAPPAAAHPVWEPHAHLRTAIGWMCGNLRLLQDHLRGTGKPTEVLDALAVCHIAGCSRVTGSATGIPRPGEVGCGSDCVRQITDYLAAIHRWVRAYAAPVSAVTTGGSAPVPYPGGATGCVVPDPTGTGGCVTAATAWMLDQVAAHVHQGPVSCWDAHAWNPTSDHPKGRACDYTFGRSGAFPGPADIRRGWALAQWLRTYAADLHVGYVIWQGRIWSAARDGEGWRPYSGGGVYDPNDPVGGHYDHVHVSLDR